MAEDVRLEKVWRREMMMLEMLAIADIRDQARPFLALGSRPLGRYLMERLYWLLHSTPMLHRKTLLSDRSPSGLVDPVLRAQVVEVKVPTLSSLLLKRDRVGEQRTNLKQHLEKSLVRLSQMMSGSLHPYIVPASKLNLGCSSNRSFVPHPSPKEAEDALELAELGQPKPCLFS